MKAFLISALLLLSAASALTTSRLYAEEWCNSTAFDDTLKINNTNRCLGVPCKRDDQCNSTYCVVNPPTRELTPSYTCANISYRPACNNSKVFQTYDVDEHLSVLQSKNICRDVPCDWDPDCAQGLNCALLPYQYPPVCSYYTPGCNASAEAVIDKNYIDGTLTYAESTSRCYNVNCLKKESCAGDLNCWNATFCGGPQCNNTLEYIFFDQDNKRQKVPAEGLCGGFECLNDDPCFYGCSNATSCLHYWSLCNNSYQVQFYNETSKAKELTTANYRCENTVCKDNSQCGFDNPCFNGTCTRQQYSCNNTAKYQIFDDVLGWQSSISENRCAGTQCHKDEQCAFEAKHKLQCQNATCAARTCNASYVYQWYADETETAKKYSAASNRCAYIMCSSDDQCSSGKCYNATCLAESQTKPTCNKTADYITFKEDDFSTAIIPTVNRCLESVCDKQSQCSTCFCKSETNTCQKSDEADHPTYPNCPSDVQPDGGNGTLVVVLSVLGGILLVCAAVGGYLLWKKKRNERILAELRANASDRSSLVDNATTPLKNNINTIVTKD